MQFREPQSLDEVLDSDKEARQHATQFIKTIPN
jgi:hypothetical protein